MEEINYNFTQTREMFMDGAVLSGYAGVSPRRKIIISVLCALILGNEVYASIITKAITTKSIVFAALAAIICAYSWVGPILQEKRLYQNFREKQYEIKVTKKEIVSASFGDDPIIINGHNYRGFKELEKYFVVYHGTKYMLIPKCAVSEDEVKRTKEILETFAATSDTTTEFPEFKPDNITEKEETDDE